MYTQHNNDNKQNDDIDNNKQDCGDIQLTVFYQLMIGNYLKSRTNAHRLWPLRRFLYCQSSVVHASARRQALDAGKDGTADPEIENCGKINQQHTYKIRI